MQEYTINKVNDTWLVLDFDCCFADFSLGCFGFGIGNELPAVSFLNDTSSNMLTQNNVSRENDMFNRWSPGHSRRFQANLKLQWKWMKTSGLTQPGTHNKRTTLTSRESAQRAWFQRLSHPHNPSRRGRPGHGSTRRGAENKHKLSELWKNLCNKNSPTKTNSKRTWHIRADVRRSRENFTFTIQESESD